MMIGVLGAVLTAESNTRFQTVRKLTDVVSPALHSISAAHRVHRGRGRRRGPGFGTPLARYSEPDQLGLSYHCISHIPLPPPSPRDGVADILPSLWPGGAGLRHGPRTTPPK